ncbi:hypothetical protein C0Q70_03942 [Pomacea canaliculata]|uniref:Prolyl 4-hydroxylase alpha subunit domain-containing protein n=1 Tax=Pomacea canaliculata TaxID=400727 RepID=A0A2T7PU61_POMCA|nr:hypothetical protein C0Q70_03942 [Pomacea canaliculata]
MADDAINTAAAKFNRDAIMKELNDKGYSVIPDVLTSEECDVYIGKYRDWLATFGADEAPDQLDSIIRSYRVGHLEQTWEVRLKAKSVFQTIWQTDKLLSSVDAALPSPSLQKRSRRRSTLRTQTGFTWTRAPYEWVSMATRGLCTWRKPLRLITASVLEKSHKQFESFYTRDGIEAQAKKSNELGYLTFNNDDVAWYQQHGCYPRKVPVPKGGMVVWDSRLVHDNCRPEEGRPNKDRWRFVVFVCMTPARWARKEGPATQA